MLMFNIKDKKQWQIFCNDETTQVKSGPLVSLTLLTRDKYETYTFCLPIGGTVLVGDIERARL